MYADVFKSEPETKGPGNKPPTTNDPNALDETLSRLTLLNLGRPATIAEDISMLSLTPLNAKPIKA